MATIAADIALTQAEIDALDLALQGVDAAGLIQPLDLPEERIELYEAFESARQKIAMLAGRKR